MSEYISQFGVKRTVGRGEGRDKKYDSSAKPAEGLHNFLEVVVDENGPVANVGEEYGNGQAKIPAGSVVTWANVLVDADSADANDISLSLVKKDGTDPLALFTNVALVKGGHVDVAGNEAAIKRVAEDRYVKVEGDRPGLKATLYVEFI